MFIILTYDIDAKRVNKIRKIVKKYLNPIQESVFEGFISESKLKMELNNSIKTEHDSIVIYELNSVNYAKKENDLGTGIPKDVMESLARALLPEIRAFYESEEGKAAFEKWKAERERSTD